MHITHNLGRLIYDTLNVDDTCMPSMMPYGYRSRKLHSSQSPRVQHNMHGFLCMLGELLTCKRELDNSEDRYTMAICKDEDTVIGHIP